MSHVAAQLSSVLLYLTVPGLVVSGILYVSFGEVTVRKLRKVSELKNLLGIEFVSGGDIVNVAQTLAWPRSFMRRRDKGRYSFLHANSEAVYSHTTKLDRILGRLFYWTMIFTVACAFASMVLSWLA